MEANLKEVFYEGTIELLTELEEALLHLADDPQDKKEIDRLFRVMHSIKGSAAMVELTEVSEFAHSLENECDYIRQGKATVTPEIIRLSLEAHDHFKNLMESYFEGVPGDSKRSEQIINDFQQNRISSAKNIKSMNYEEKIQEIYLKLDEILEKDEEFNQEQLAPTGKLITQLYFLSVFANKESISEFLSEFEKFIRLVREQQLAIDKELKTLLVGVKNEMATMIFTDENNMEDMDPDKILAALERPMELKNKLEEIKKKMKISDHMLPPQEKLLIKIQAPVDDKGRFTRRKKLLGILERLGDFNIITDTFAEFEKMQILASEGLVKG